MRKADHLLDDTVKDDNIHSEASKTPDFNDRRSFHGASRSERWWMVSGTGVAPSRSEESSGRLTSSRRCSTGHRT